MPKKPPNPDFTPLKLYFMETWKLRNGDYPFTAIDASILNRLLYYGLQKAMAILDLGRIMICEDDWTKNKFGKTLRGLIYIHAKILDDHRLDIYIKKHEPKKNPESQEIKVLMPAFPKAPDFHRQRVEMLRKAESIP